MNERHYQVTVRNPRRQGGRFTVSYKLSVGGQLRTILGTGLTMRDARDQAERQIRAVVGPDHEALKSLAKHGLDSSRDEVPF